MRGCNYRVGGRKKNVNSKTKKGMVKNGGEYRGLTEIISKVTNTSELALPCERVARFLMGYCIQSGIKLDFIVDLDWTKTGG